MKFPRWIGWFCALVVIKVAWGEETRVCPSVTAERSEAHVVACFEAQGALLDPLMFRIQQAAQCEDAEISLVLKIAPDGQAEVSYRHAENLPEVLVKDLLAAVGRMNFGRSEAGQTQTVYHDLFFSPSLGLLADEGKDSRLSLAGGEATGERQSENLCHKPALDPATIKALIDRNTSVEAVARRLKSGQED